MDKINQYFKKYGDYFEKESIKYTSNLVRHISSNSPDLKEFLDDNEITDLLLINEIAPISSYKFLNFGDEKLAMSEIQDVLDFIVFSNELENQMMEDNVRITSIGEDGILFYTANDDARYFFLEKYGIDIPEGEFDYTIMDNFINENEDEEDDGFNVRLN
jgi:hypothetical protein